MPKHAGESEQVERMRFTVQHHLDEDKHTVLLTGGVWETHEGQVVWACERCKSLVAARFRLPGDHWQVRGNRDQGIPVRWNGERWEPWW